MEPDLSAAAHRAGRLQRNTAKLCEASAGSDPGLQGPAVTWGKRRLLSHTKGSSSPSCIFYVVPVKIK